MHTLSHLIQSIDLHVYYWLSRFHGNWYLDRFVSRQESNTLLKCGLLTAMYWYFWFREDGEQQQRRGTILTILTGTLVGLVFTRVLATLMPFRVRPLLDPTIQHSPLSIPTPSGFVDWSSFPSDHAAYLCALGFGLIWLSRRFTIPVVLYLAGWICLPRLYLGIHYASDLVVGAAIGVIAVWASLRTKWVDASVSRPLLAFADSKPQIFYAAAFLGMFEMTTLFWDLQEPIHGILHGISSMPHHKIVAAALMVLAALFVASLVVIRRVHPKSENEAVDHVLTKAVRAGRS